MYDSLDVEELRSLRASLFKIREDGHAPDRIRNAAVHLLSSLGAEMDLRMMRRQEDREADRNYGVDE